MTDLGEDFSVLVCLSLVLGGLGLSTFDDDNSMENAQYYTKLIL